MTFLSISSIPDNLTPESLLETIGRNSFALIYDLKMHTTYFWFKEESNNIIDNLNSLPGLALAESHFEPEIKNKTISALSFYRNDEEMKDPLSDLFNLNNYQGFVSLIFLNLQGRKVEEAKHYAENLLTSKEIRKTESRSYGQRGSSGSSSIHKEIYKDSEELILAKNILDSINGAVLKNNLLYKLFFIFDSENKSMEQYLKDRFSILAESTIAENSFSLLIDKLEKQKAFPFGSDYCSKFLQIYGVRKLHSVKTGAIASPNHDLSIGKVLIDGVGESRLDISIDKSTLNLGMLITGLPGSGKTTESMHIIDRITNTNCPCFVIAPSEEWDGFAISHGMNLIRLFGDSVQINFFRCPPMANKDRFCQDLAIILSSATGAGPYRRPMEKCMLNAFKKAYQNTTNPDPVDLYTEIEEAIISLHGKRTNVGVKYTKHGENIKAALENLRIILNSQNYSSPNGTKFEELLVGGAVFDMSSASIATKSFLYALILNQLYALTSNFDTNGDEELRMLICIEEAQITFKEETSPAVEDLKQRIQDFRKRGIGLMLLAHNLSDIDLGIRRLCQTRLYMKQAPDSAYLASKELIFPGVEPEKVIEKLKLLNSRTSALNFITKNGKEKIQEESIFIKTEAFQPQQITLKTDKTLNDELKAEISITLGDYLKGSEFRLEIRYLGELVSNFPISGKINTKLITDRKYEVRLINARNKIVGYTLIQGKQNLKLFIDNDKLLELE